MTKGEKADAAFSALLNVQNRYGYIGEVHGSSNECFEMIENAARNEGSVIVTHHAGILVVSSKPLTKAQLKECAKVQKTYDKYEEYL